MTFGAYLQSQSLPAKKAVLRPSTYGDYRRNAELHVIPTLGRIPIRRLRGKHLEELYDRLAHPTGDTRALCRRRCWRSASSSGPRSPTPCETNT